MNAKTTRLPVSTSLPRAVDGYDFAAESVRARSFIEDTEVCGNRLNRTTAVVTFRENEAWAEATRAAHRAAIFQTTVDPDSPVLELGWPTSGHYVTDGRGVHFDLYLGVGQRLFDDHHPALIAAVKALDAAGLMLRREINTDDYLRVAPHIKDVHAPHELAALIDGAVAKAFPGSGAWKTFFTNSGTESVEACLKLAYQVRYKRFVATHGLDTLAKVMAELGITEFMPLSGDTSKPDPVYNDYPFFIVGLKNAFHGRTLGALAITASKKAQKLGYPRSRWICHIPANQVGALAEVIDQTPLATHLATPGSLRKSIESGRVPAELLAGCLLEPLQGEGGYVPCTSEFMNDVATTCRAAGGLFLVDEVQTFGRSGTVFFTEQLGVTPDAMSLAKGMFGAAMVARADLNPHLHTGWHSNTWGGGKMFDNQIAYAVLDLLLNGRSPVFLGKSYPENLLLKGKLVEAGFRELRTRHPNLVTDHMVRGGLTRISVRRRADIIHAAWQRGLKLLPCGRAGDVAAIRMLFLADVLATEISEALDLLDLALCDVESATE